MADCARGVITSCWTLLPRVPSPALVKITWPDGVDPTVASAWKPAVTSTPPVRRVAHDGQSRKPIRYARAVLDGDLGARGEGQGEGNAIRPIDVGEAGPLVKRGDRKSTRLNSSHSLA